MALANFYQTTNQAAKLAAELERIERDSVHYPGGALRVAEFHYRSGRLQDAEAQARETLAAGPKDRVAYERMLLKTLGTEGKLDELKRLSEEILSRDPKAVHALTARSTVMLEQPTPDNVKQALKDLELLLQLNPADEYSRFQAGKAYRMMGDRPKAAARPGSGKTATLFHVPPHGPRRDEF